MTACATIVAVRPPRAAGTLRAAVAAVRARPSAAAAVAAALLWCTLWFSAGPPAQAAGALVPVQSAEPAPDAQPDERGDVRRGRCASCGFVVGIRELQPTGFEFTVRLRDGSVRISRAASRGTWHIGDPVMLMGEPAAPGQ